MFIKICANTNLEDVRLAAELCVDAVGFVFAPSKRRVTPEQVGEITRQIPEGIRKVGVFTSKDAEEILQAAKVAGLTGVQLHCAYDSALVDAIDVGSGSMLHVVQVVDVRAGMDLVELRAVLTAVLSHRYVQAALRHGEWMWRAGWRVRRGRRIRSGCGRSWRRRVRLDREIASCRACVAGVH